MSSKTQLASKILSAFGQARNCCPHHSAGRMFEPVRLRTLHQELNDSAQNEYAFEMISSTLRFGIGVTSEVGQDLVNVGAKKTLVVTDPNVVHTPAFLNVADSLTRNKVAFDVFDQVRIEPTDVSFQQAITAARADHYDSFVAVGGGSTIDTTKAAALLASHPDNELFDFVVAPFGKQTVPANALLPLIAVPTTAGTGSETTGVAVFDYEAKRCKTALRLRELKPRLAIIDPLNIQSMPRHVAIYSGFDVLCHALESYTARPFSSRTPRPDNPINRPLYQGSNPISDVWARETFRIIAAFFRRSVDDADDLAARAQMLLAASFAGVGFGNAGVHLCHGLSYPISGQVKEFRSPDYDAKTPLIPHGLSVVMTAPADFIFTCDACPEKHLDAAALLGANTNGKQPRQAGHLVADVIRKQMREFGVPNGLRELGFDRPDVSRLAAGAMSSLSALQLSPRQHTEEAIAAIYNNSFTVY